MSNGSTNPHEIFRVQARFPAAAVIAFLETFCTFQCREFEPAVKVVIMTALEEVLRSAPRQEVEFCFAQNDQGGNGTTLRSPAPLIKLLDWMFATQVRVTLKDSTHAPTDQLIKSGTNLILRVTPDLVTFGGVVVWQRQAQ